MTSLLVLRTVGAVTALAFLSVLGFAETEIVDDTANASIEEIKGPDDLNLDPAKVLIAVDCFGDEDREVNGIVFQTDRPGDGEVTNEASGVTVITTAPNRIDNWAAAPFFDGKDQESADNLAELMRDIRWNGAPNPVEIEITGLPDNRVEVQILLNEGANRNRRWDIGLSENEHDLIFDDITSEGISAGSGLGDEGVWSDDNSFVATFEADVGVDGTVLVIMQQHIGGQDSPGGDNNPIIQGIIVSSTADPVDTDEDGMFDWYEVRFDLDPEDPSDAGSDDDNDGLTALQESAKGTHPKKADTDGDGLRDDVETGTGIWVSPENTGTSPTNADTDRDGVGDGVETNTRVFVNGRDAGTDPHNPNTDGDRASDGEELTAGTNPLDQNSFPPSDTLILVGPVLREGSIREILGPEDLNLDPSRTLIAVDVYGDKDREIESVLFRTDKCDDCADHEGEATNEATGVTVKLDAANRIDNWATAPEFMGGTGDSADNLAEVMRDIRWHGAPNPVIINIEGLAGGSLYEVQLLVNEGADRNRHWDIGVELDGELELVVDNFTSEGEAALDGEAGGRYAEHNSFAFVGVFEAAKDGTLRIVMQQLIDSPDGTESKGGDNNPILQGVIVSSAGAGPIFQITEIVQSDDEVTITWPGTPGAEYAIDFLRDLSQPIWIEVDDGVTSEGGETSFTDDDPARISLPQGWYRVRQN